MTATFTTYRGGTIRHQLDPADPPVTLLGRIDGSGTRIQAETVEEHVQEIADGELSYTVTVRGPVLTKTGKPHARNSENRRFSDPPSWWHKPLADLPPELAAVLRGPEACKQWGLLGDRP